MIQLRFFLVCALMLLASAGARAQCTGTCAITTVGGDTVVRFTGNGTFTPPSGVTDVRYLVVGGGAGGGGIAATTNLGGGGGGGAGGYRAATGFTVTPLTVYNITVGGGGAGGTGGVNGGGTAGTNNSIFSTITSQGGGGGSSSGATNNGVNGASGGGSRVGGTPGTGVGGQGNAGGNSGNAGGGGGGASAAGGTGGAAAGGAGGTGTVNNITGANVTYAAGGAGGNFGTRAAGASAAANTGNGGGGAAGSAATGAFSGGAGGSGVVIIRYTTPPPAFYSRVATGNWSTNATWSNAGCNGAAATSTPTATSDVTICDGHTITVNVAAVAQSVTLQTGNNAVNLTHSGANSLTVGAGGVTLAGGTAGTQTKAWNINAGSATVNGPINLNGGSSNARVVGINLTSGTLDINGDLTMTAGNNVRAVIEATGAANVFLSGDFNFNAGTLTPGPSSTFTYDGTGGFSLAHSATIQYRHLVVNKSGGTSTQTGSTLTVLGNLDLQAGTVNIGTASIAVTGTTTIGGTLGITSATGSAVFTGDVTVNGTWSNTANEAVTMAASLINNGTFTSGTGAYTFSGDGQWGGSQAISFGGNVTVSANADRINNNAAVSVTGTLALGNAATMTNNATVSVTGDITGGNTASTWTNTANSTLNAGNAVLTTGTLVASANGNTVHYNGAGNETVKLPSGNAYFHLTISTGGTKTPSGGTYNVGGNLTVNTGATLNVTTNDPVINVTGDATIGGTYTASNVGASALTVTGNLSLGGTFTGSTSPVNLGGNFTNNGTFNTGTGLFTFNGAAGQQTLSGTTGTTSIGSMALDNADGLAMSSGHNLTLNTALTFTSGRITTNAGILFLNYAGGAVTGANATSFVVGNLRKIFATGGSVTRTFEVGTEAGDVRAATVSITLNVGTAGNFTVSSTAGDHPNIATSSLSDGSSINRYWTLTRNSGTINTSAANSITFNYVNPGDYDAGANFNQFYLGNYVNPNWTEFTPTTRNATFVTLTGTAITQASIGGDWQVASREQVALTAATLLCGTSNQVEVIFSQTVTSGSATNIANYALTNGAAISSASLDTGGRVVTLTTSSLTSGTGYTLTVNNVVGTNGITIAAGSTATFFTDGGYRSGLFGSYFNVMALPVAGSTPTGTRVDGPVDFNWAAGAPGVAGIGVDHFSVRWTGYVTPDKSGDYQFRTRSDDGLRLYFNNVLVVDNWDDHAAEDDTTAPITLVAGTRYPVTMEFYENGGDAVAQLSWSGPGTGGFQFIPRANLSHQCGLPQPVALYRMDEGSWAGAGAVIDSSGNNLHGTALGGATPAPAKVCNGVSLDGVGRYIEVADNALLDMPGSFTVTAWIRANALTGALRTIVSKDENFEFHLTDTGQINWWWQNSSAVAETITTTGTAMVANTWYHVAIVYDTATAPNQRIYIDGVLRGSASFTNGLLQNNDPMQIGSDQGTGGRFFDGLIDEVRVYNQALSAANIATIMADTRTCAVFFDHVRIEHDGTGLTCQPETMTVKACADATCSTLYAGAVSTSLTPTGWVGGDSINFVGGSTTAQLRKLTSGAVTLGAGSTSPTPVGATRCFIGGTETCSLDFKTAGFIFDVPTLTSCKPSASITMTAVRADDTSQKCVPAFNAGSRSVNFWSTYSNPASGTKKVTVNSTAVDTTAPGATSPVSLAFTGGATTTFTVTYPDAGQVILNARYTGTGTVNGNDETGLVMNGSDTFVAVPVGLAVIPSGGACVAGDATCAKYRKAGEAFTHTVRAACWTSDGDTNLSDNPVTPNFQMAGIPLAHTRVAPSPGVDGTLGVASVSISTGGTADVTTQTLSEVGVFKINAAPAASAYLGETVPGGSSVNIGRFYPDHFLLSGATTVGYRPDSACSPASAFNYLGEPFNLAFTLQAEKVGGGLTQNYAGSFAKLDPAVIGNLGFGAREGATLLTSRLSLVSSSGSFTAGSASVSAKLGVQRAAAPDGPFAAAQFGIAPVDSDAVAMTGIDFDGDAAPGNDRKNLGASVLLRFGRLRLQGTAGSVLLPARLPLQLQYWNGSAFAVNADDGCTTLARENFALNFDRAPLAACNTAVAPTLTFTGGAATLPLSKPNPANAGSVVVTAVLGGDSGLQCAASPGAQTNAVGALRSYLQGAWTGGAWDQDPSARVGFGVYGAQPNYFIFQRENY